MAFRTLKCPHCGAPLPPDAKKVVVVCAACGAAVTDDGPVVRAADYRQALAERRAAAASPSDVTLGGLSYRLLGLLARGESSNVFLAERAEGVTERVVIKILRASTDADLLQREAETLERLYRSEVDGAAYFTRLLPQMVARGPLRQADGNERQAQVFRYPSGFVHTLDDVKRAFPSGVEARHVVWIWRRILEVLSFVHRSGVAHGAILPQHVLIHSGDHGARLVGWSCATERGSGERLPAVNLEREAFYPIELRKGGIATPSTDLCMVARNMIYLLGGEVSENAPPASTPAPFAQLLRLHADPHRPGDRADAWRLSEQVSRAAREVYGPPTFVPFHMPEAR